MLSKSDIKYIQSLSEKKFREVEHVFVIESPKITDEALQHADVRVKKIYALTNWIDANTSLLSNTTVIAVSEYELNKISQLKTPNQVLAIVEMPWSEGFRLAEKSLALALDGIQDPGNMGTIIRIADWFGIKKMICSTDCADRYNSKVVQASMGSIFRIEMLYADLTEWLSLQDVPIIGAGLNGEPLSAYPKPQDGVLVIGNESKGIRKEILPLVQRIITIPKTGAAESLNAAVATGIILSHIV